VTRQASSVDERAVWAALEQVPDPEIPVVSVVDLGLVRSVELDGERLRVELLPTFVGCPALELIRESVAARLAGMARHVEVEMSFAEPWTSDRITAEGRRRLRESGFAPPEPTGDSAGRSLPIVGQRSTPSRYRPQAVCPWCGSADTALENPFGPTRCRAIFWCNRCRQPFEQFKAV
jgi:ring-1,2-phenylacetyl-CoA epoxidase subunit PaaD